MANFGGLTHAVETCQPLSLSFYYLLALFLQFQVVYAQAYHDYLSFGFLLVCLIERGVT